MSTDGPQPTQGAPKKKRKRRKVGRLFFAWIVFLFLVFFFFFSEAPWVFRVSQRSETAGVKKQKATKAPKKEKAFF